jgi:GTP-binding protein
VLNKWDLVAKDQHSVRRYTDQLRDAAKFLAFAPVLTISALTGQRVQRIFKLTATVHAQYIARVNTGRINRILEQALADNEPSLHRGRRIKFFYATQAATRPPTFVMFVNYPEAVHFSYQRYLVNRLRLGAGLHDTPIRLVLRPRAGRRAIGTRPRRRERPGRKPRRSR